MAEDFLEETYRIADAYTKMQNLVNFHRINVGTSNFDTNVQPLLQIFAKVAKLMLEKYDMRGKQLWEALQRLADYYNFAPILDEIEGNCMPIISDYLQEQPKIDVDDGKIRLRSSRVGFIYLSGVEKPRETYDSALNPMQEAYYIAKNIYHPAKYKYVFLGCGLGYIPYQLYILSEGEIDIHIFFYDKESYEYARLYGVLDWIPKENLHVTVSDSMTSFLICATDNCDEYYFYKADLSKYTSEELSKIEIFVRSKNTEYATKEIKNDNFYRNIRRTERFVSEYDSSNIKEKCILVAGGPSVDDNISFLKEAKEKNMSIICVGTVLKKLLNLNIVPDVVAACDPFISVASQFEEVNLDSIPLMLGLNTNWRVAKAYKGEKYLVALDGIKDDTLKYVKNRKEMIYPSAATVTSMAFNLIAKWGVKEIYLVGADFGFPGKMSHATDTVYREEVNSVELMLVDGVSGKVYSDPQMTEYRKQIEEYILDNSDIKVYNMSKNGARIKGTIEV